MNNIGEIMKYTSAEANKLLKKLNDEIQTLATKEAIGKEFLAASSENVEDVRPDYNFADIHKQWQKLEEQVCIVKHAINVFNTTTVIPEFGFTIDRMLVYIPQLNRRKNQLSDMVRKLPKVREISTRAGNIIDYRYINYDLKEVSAELERITELLNRAQNALDNINGSVTFEIEI